MDNHAKIGQIWVPPIRTRSWFQRLNIVPILVLIAFIIITSIMGSLNAALGVIVIFLLVWFIFDRPVYYLFGYKPSLLNLFLLDEHYEDNSEANEWFKENKIINLDETYFNSELFKKFQEYALFGNITVFCSLLIPGGSIVRRYGVATKGTLYVVSTNLDSAAILSEECRMANNNTHFKVKPIILTESSAHSDGKMYLHPSEFYNICQRSDPPKIGDLITISGWSYIDSNS